MINYIPLTLKSRFKDIKKGDILIVEFEREYYPLKGLLHSFVLPEQNYLEKGEVILQKKGNVYFNYEMFLKDSSIVKNVMHVFL